MHGKISDKMKLQFVNAISDGLYLAKIEIHSSDDIVKTRIPYTKIDKICTSVIDTIKLLSEVRYVICQRSWYPVLFVYDTADKTIYSFMRGNRFRTLLNRKDLAQMHYIDALIEFNLEWDADEQTILDERFLAQDELQIQKLKREIIAMLGGDTPSEYVTVCYDLDGFQLRKVEAFMSSNHLQIIDRTDWSDCIGVDYNEIIDTEKTDSENDTSELDIKLKPNLPPTPPSSEDLDINALRDEELQSENLS